MSALVVLQYVVFGGLTLYLGRDVLVPIAYAILVSFILYPICSWLEQRRVSRIGAISISIGLLSVLITGVLLLLIRQVSDFGTEWTTIQPKIASAQLSLRQFISESMGISITQQDQWLAKLPEQLLESLFTLLKGTVSISASALIKGILIPVYIVLILYHRDLWKNVMYRLFKNQSHQYINDILKLTVATYFNFIKGMALVYLIVGALNSVGLLILEVPHPFLFGFVASVLTFVPYIGIMIGALIPVTIAWVTHDSLWYPIGVVGVFAFVQYLEANVIFPFAVSSQLKVNTMAVLVSIFIGGLLWGVSGMILFVPFVGILKLIADSHTGWETISLALGTEVSRSQNT